MAKKQDHPGELLVCHNRRVTTRYQLAERFEAGIVLSGSEVKSLRQRRADLEGAYASFDKQALFLHKMHIGPYEQASVFAHAAKASRKLLLHKREIQKIHGRLTQRGFTLVPVRVYFKGGWAKVELALATHKSHEDRRQDLRAKAVARETRLALRQRRGGGG